MYKAIIKDEAVRSIENQRAHMIAAIFANPNWDDPKNNRTQLLTEINGNFNDAIDLINSEGRKEDEIDWEGNAFYAAAKRNLDKTKAHIEMVTKGQPLDKIVKMDEEQLRARADSQKSIDQI